MLRLHDDGCVSRLEVHVYANSRHPTKMGGYGKLYQTGVLRAKSPAEVLVD